MSGIYDTAAFMEFCTARKDKLSRIANRADKAIQVGDVISTAWEMACELHTKGIDIDFRDPASQDLIIRYTYQKLINYAEKNLRFAVRLDKAPAGSDDDCHPLMRRLHDPNALDPLEQLIAQEEQRAAKPVSLGPHLSIARAYVRLLENFRGSVPAIAHYLRISVSHTYRCWARAREYEAHQLRIPMRIKDKTFQPRPWRSFKLYRTPQQLTLDFEEDLLSIE
ncbi:MAG: hypothetical protein L0H54_14365 [Alcaligenaceae bacterium]|nr:hypothetical protein [Alcaligenaceae bacterium]